MLILTISLSIQTLGSMKFLCIKPIFFNMDLAYSNLQIVDFILFYRCWNVDALNEVVVLNINLSLLNLRHVDPDTEVNWVWL